MIEDLYLPNLFLAGAPKCGTTALYAAFRASNDVFVPAQKELRVLFDPEYPLRRPYGSRSPEVTYRRVFQSHTSFRYRIDATPDYLYQKYAPRWIGQKDGAKTIFVFRNPLDRLRSLYQFARGNIGSIPRSLTWREYVEALLDRPASLGQWPILAAGLEHSRYVDYLATWDRYVCANAMLVVLSEDLRASPELVAQDVASFLGLEEGLSGRAVGASANATYEPKFPALHHRLAAVRAVFPQGRLRSRVGALYSHVASSTPRPVEPLPAELKSRLVAALEPSVRALSDRLQRSLPWQLTDTVAE